MISFSALVFQDCRG